MTHNSDEWLVIARLADLSGAPDVAVSKLKANGIPVMRWPLTPSGSPYAAGRGTEPVRILVPPERADEARDLLRTFSEIPS